ncbi:hypothetical protein HID58_028754 [Brassica napus]|uniref:Uncharacterized protein n=1 Tax=Brassica napus TaxID=3708 RepID=A0ABQ8CB81_BRANA|nr:hypothetical protein HID58_028754 [Brassica napus]
MVRRTRASDITKGKVESPEPRAGSSAVKNVNLRSHKPATSCRRCHHVPELKPINGPTIAGKDRKNIKTKS